MRARRPRHKVEEVERGPPNRDHFMERGVSRHGPCSFVSFYFAADLAGTCFSIFENNVINRNKCVLLH